MMRFIQIISVLILLVGLSGLDVHAKNAQAQAFKAVVAQTYSWPEFNPKWQIPLTTYKKAQDFYSKNQKILKNKRYVSIINMALHSSKKRFLLFDLKTKKVEARLTSAGRNSDPDGDGFATAFSNTPDSKQTSLGFYLTLDTYKGIHGHSLKLKGLEPTNSNAEARAIVIHAAKYVQEDKKHAGRSWGCPALDPKIAKPTMKKIKSGSLLYITK